MSELNHPNVLELKAYSIGKGKLQCGENLVSENSTYFVMPLMGKGDLGSYLKMPNMHFSEKMSSFFFA